MKTFYESNFQLILVELGAVADPGFSKKGGGGAEAKAKSCVRKRASLYCAGGVRGPGGGAPGSSRDFSKLGPLIWLSRAVYRDCKCNSLVHCMA